MAIRRNSVAPDEALSIASYLSVVSWILKAILVMSSSSRKLFLVLYFSRKHPLVSSNLSATCLYSQRYDTALPRLPRLTPQSATIDNRIPLEGLQQSRSQVPGTRYLEMFLIRWPNDGMHAEMYIIKLPLSQ